MEFSEGQVPSNRKFGLFFSLVFAVVAGYYHFTERLPCSYLFVVTSVGLLVVSLTNSDALLPLNRQWMKLGYLLGKFVSPIVLGVVFFGIFTPTSILMRLFGRDELRLKVLQRPSYWIPRKSQSNAESFEKQF